MSEQGQTKGGLDTYTAYLAKGAGLHKLHLDIREHANRLQEAMDVYSMALEMNPDGYEALYGMARVALESGQYAKATRYARKALDTAKSNHDGDAGMVLGELALRKGELDEAWLYFSKAARRKGLQSFEACLGLFRSAWERGNQPGQAAQWKSVAVICLAGALMSYPFSPNRLSLQKWLQLIPLWLGAWLQDEFGAPDEALSRYLKIHRYFPGLAAAGLIIGDIYREKGQLDKAVYWFERVISRHPARLDAYYHLAKVLERQEDYPGMAQTYEKLAGLKPTDPHVFCNMANAYYFSQCYKEALSYYEKALHLGHEPRWKARVAQSMGNIQADHMENEDAAIAYYEMSKTLNPDDVENYIQLGMLYFQKEDYENAENIYRQAMRVAPGNPRFYSNAGYLRWMDGDIENAVTFYEKAIELDSSYEIPLNNLGVICLDTLGQVHRAIDLFGKAVAINQNYALAFYNMGRAHSMLNDRLQAAICFQTAQNLNRFSHELDSEELTARINNLFDTDDVADEFEKASDFPSQSA